MTLSASTRVTVHVDKVSLGGDPSTDTIMPTLLATLARISPLETRRIFSQFGGSVQYQNGSYFGSVYWESRKKGSQFDNAVGSCWPACRSPRPYRSICTLPVGVPLVIYRTRMIAG